MFSNQEGHEHEIIATLCAVKAMITWHNAHTASVCRERCGGATYLYYNICGEVILQAHSGMTAEGDNSVLMQKVVKDILTNFRKKKHIMPKISLETISHLKKLPYATSAVTLKNLIYLKEQIELKQIMVKL